METGLSGLEDKDIFWATKEAEYKEACAKMEICDLKMPELGEPKLQWAFTIQCNNPIDFVETCKQIWDFHKDRTSSITGEPMAVEGLLALGVTKIETILR